MYSLTVRKAFCILLYVEFQVPLTTWISIPSPTLNVAPVGANSPVYPFVKLLATLLITGLRLCHRVVVVTGDDVIFTNRNIHGLPTTVLPP